LCWWVEPNFEFRTAAEQLAEAFLDGQRMTVELTVPTANEAFMVCFSV
jgi:hypothetical protein